MPPYDHHAEAQSARAVSGNFQSGPSNPNVGASTAQHDTVGDALGRLENRFSDLWKGMQELEARLQPVLRPQPPSDSAGASAPTPIHGVRDAVNRLCNNADALSMNITRLINRIEL